MGSYKNIIIMFRVEINVLSVDKFLLLRVAYGVLYTFMDTPPYLVPVYFNFSLFGSMLSF